MIFERGLRRVCSDIFFAVENVRSERVVLQCLLSTVWDDILVAFEDVW